LTEGHRDALVEAFAGDHLRGRARLPDDTIRRRGNASAQAARGRGVRSDGRQGESEEASTAHVVLLLVACFFLPVLLLLLLLLPLLLLPLCCVAALLLLLNE